jgi:NAD(P)-dependent dehydrogenase (short-subunit alcohol dehydrogenase family)
MDLGLEGQGCLITGGSRGIGRATALALCREGARVAVAAREPAVLEETAAAIEAETGRRPETVVADCTRAADVTAMVETVARRLGRIDILVNSIGAAKGGDFLRLTEEDWEDSLALKLMGQIRCCREVLAGMRAQGRGAIVNVIGHRGKQPDGHALPAGVANAGLMNFTLGLAQEEARHGIRVVGINPAPVETRRLQSVFDTEARLQGISTEEARRRWLAQVPLGRAASPAEIAAVIVFLASPRASFVTGAILHVDGGATRCL